MCLNQNTTDFRFGRLLMFTKTTCCAGIPISFKLYKVLSLLVKYSDVNLIYFTRKGFMDKQNISIYIMEL